MAEIYPKKEFTSSESEEAEYTPFVPPHVQLKELTVKSILLGLLFALVFGASSAFLGLRTGITIGGSIPIAVIGIGVLKRFAKLNILENNVVQAIGSSGESVVSAIVFRTTALLFLTGGAKYFHYPHVLVLSILGSLLGVFLMIPLRRSLIVKEHKTLLYPEGTACADVLIAGEKQGVAARPIFSGALMAILYWVCMKLFGLWNELPRLLHRLADVAYPNATLAVNVTPEYMGIGYILGPRASFQMMLGGLLNALVLIPLFSALPKMAPWFGAKGVYQTLSDLGILVENQNLLPNALQVHQAYGKFVAIGAVVCAGLMTLAKSISVMGASVKTAFDSIKDQKFHLRLRTERDIPMWLVLLGIILIFSFTLVLPYVPGKYPVSVLMAVLVIAFGFFFVTVASRLAGVIGYSMEPIGPMMFTTVMVACLIFILLRLTSVEDQVLVLIIGVIVSTAATNAGATSQDLKTGFLLGATPWKLQLAIVVGVVVSSVVMTGIVFLIDKSIPGVTHAIGYIPPSGDAVFPAPPANIIATLIKAVLTGNIPWGLVFFGAALALMVQLSGMAAFSFAVGIYLPLEVTLAIFLGALVRILVKRKEKQQTTPPSPSDMNHGMLYATGLVAGGSIAGMILGFWNGFFPSKARFLDVGHFYLRQMPWPDLIPIVVFFLLGAFLYRQATKKPSR